MRGSGGSRGRKTRADTVSSICFQIVPQGGVRACVYTGKHLIDVQKGVPNEFRSLYNSTLIIAFDQQSFPAVVLKFILREKKGMN